MSISKKVLEPFSENELMKIIDCFIQTGNSPLSSSSHTYEEYQHLLSFLGLGVKRVWTEEEVAILQQNYYSLGANGTANLLDYRTEYDCANKATHLALKTRVKKGHSTKKAQEWQTWEDKILEKYYPIIGCKTAALLPSRSEAACASRAVKNGITKASVCVWSLEDDIILTNQYHIIGTRVQKDLPQKSISSIKRRAHALGLSFEDNPWSSEDDGIITTYYPIIGSKVHSMLSSKRSAEACRLRALSLGVSYCAVSNKWSDHELRVLRENYENMGTDVSKLLSGRSPNACKHMANRCGLICKKKKSPRMSQSQWSKDELLILKDYYPKIGSSAYSYLPGRSPNACRVAAQALHLHVKSKCWTEEEDNILMKYYPIEGVKSFNRLPNRSSSSCSTRASRLKIKRKTC